MKTALIHSDQWTRFDYGPDHPLRMERLGLTWRLMEAYGLTSLADAKVYRLRVSLDAHPECLPGTRLLCGPRATVQGHAKSGFFAASKRHKGTEDQEFKHGG